MTKNPSDQGDRSRATETRLIDHAMRYDDPSAFYDAPQSFYDMNEPAGPTQNHRMAKPKLELKGLTHLQKVQKTSDIVTATTGNPNFLTPNPSLATLTGKADALAAAYSAREAAKQTLEQKQTELNTADADLESTLTLFTAYVETTSGGEAAKILSSGLGVRGAPTPIGPLPQVEGLDAIIGDAEGQLTLRWKSVRGAKTYEVQCCTDPITVAGWAGVGLPTKATLIVTGLTSGTRCWFRVRAIGTAGPGPWSDPCVKTVP